MLLKAILSDVEMISPCGVPREFVVANEGASKL